MSESVLVPLSALDQNGVETSSITFGYILKTTTYDSKALDAAAGRLAEKWRLIAGRLEWDAQEKTWCIRVPLGKLDGVVTHKFTTSQSNKPLDTPLTETDATSSIILPRPALKNFRHSSTPSSLSAFCSQNAPIVSIHVSTLANCTCVGISVPHGAFDATGMGQIIHGLDAELHGKPWDAPSFGPENIMRTVLKELHDVGPVQEEPEALKNIQREFFGVKAATLAKFAFGVAREYLWHKAEVKGIYLGEKVVARIVNEAKEKVKVETDGKNFVSTGDILVAWFLKAAHSDEAHTNEPVSVTSSISLRTVLSPKEPAFDTYSHNAIMPCSLPLTTTASLKDTSIAQFSLIHRDIVKAVRSRDFLQSYIRWVNSPAVGGNALPVHRVGVHSWIFSNQVIGGLDKIDFGVEQLAFWHWNAPIIPDHSVILNKFDGGYMLEAGVRKSRWLSLEREVQSLQAQAK